MHDDSVLVERRIRRELLEKVLPAMYSATMPMTVQAWDAPGEPVPYGEAMAALATQARPFAIGAKWSRPWGTTWFRFRTIRPIGLSPQGDMRHNDHCGARHREFEHVALRGDQGREIRAARDCRGLRRTAPIPPRAVPVGAG